MTSIKIPEKGSSPVAGYDYCGHIIKTAVLEDNILKLTFEDDSQVDILDDASICCEERFITCDDDIQSLVGARLLSMTQKDGDEVPNTEGYTGEHQTCFIEIQTDKGFVTLTTHNIHNGEYSGFRLILRPGETKKEGIDISTPVDTKFANTDASLNFEQHDAVRRALNMSARFAVKPEQQEQTPVNISTLDLSHLYKPDMIKPRATYVDNRLYSQKDEPFRLVLFLSRLHVEQALTFVYVDCTVNSLHLTEFVENRTLENFWGDDVVIIEIGQYFDALEQIETHAQALKRKLGNINVILPPLSLIDREGMK